MVLSIIYLLIYFLNLLLICYQPLCFDSILKFVESTSTKRRPLVYYFFEETFKRSILQAEEKLVTFSPN